MSATKHNSKQIHPPSINNTMKSENKYKLLNRDQELKGIQRNEWGIFTDDKPSHPHLSMPSQ